MIVLDAFVEEAHRAGHAEEAEGGDLPPSTRGVGEALQEELDRDGGAEEDILAGPHLTVGATAQEDVDPVAAGEEP
jgi:hypothetical protein